MLLMKPTGLDATRNCAGMVFRKLQSWLVISPNPMSPALTAKRKPVLKRSARVRARYYRYGDLERRLQTL